MTVTAQHLNENARGALATHFLALSAEDRRLRFGSSLLGDGIRAYVGSIDFYRDALFAVHDDGLALLGVAHVAFGKDAAELGLSVLAAHRGCGVGSTLFQRAAAHVRNRFLPRLYMHCLRGNAPMMRIAARFGMDVVTEIGEADAHLELPPASPASIAGEFVAERFALYDYALKTHVTAWKRFNIALLGAANAEEPRHSRTMLPCD